MPAARTVSTERRTWNTPVRSDWNAGIHSALGAIDLHVKLHLETGDAFHLEMADTLRSYVSNLKTWIHSQERLSQGQDDFGDIAGRT